MKFFTGTKNANKLFQGLQNVILFCKD